MKKGIFITFEGCEGSGKSTQLKLFKEYLDKNNVEYVFFREPGSTVISEKIRDVILDINNVNMSSECEALLYSAARSQLVKECILPALNQGKLVLCDRYIDSSFAYQAFARGLGMDYVLNINDYAVKNCMPNYTLFFDISPDDAFKRKGGADSGDRLEQSGMEFHKKVYEGYKRIAEIYSDRIIKINCLGAKNETHLNIISALKSRGVL